MAWLAGDNFGFGFVETSDDDSSCYDPSIRDAGDDEDLGGGPYSLSDVEEFCVSAFAFPNGGGEENEDDEEGILVAEDRESHGSRPAREDPADETLGDSSDFDGDFSQLFGGHFIYQDTFEEEISGEDPGLGTQSGFGPELRPVTEENGDDDDGLADILSGLSLDWRPVTRGSRARVDAGEGTEEDSSDDGMGFVGGPMLSGSVPRPSPAGGAFRMRVEVTDPDDDDVITVDSWRRPAARAVVEGLPEAALSEEEASSGCAVCKDGIATEERALRLPCKHFFHGECIRPWLDIRNTCPVCRYELPTENPVMARYRGRVWFPTVQRTSMEPEVSEPYAFFSDSDLQFRDC